MKKVTAAVIIALAAVVAGFFAIPSAVKAYRLSQVETAGDLLAVLDDFGQSCDSVTRDDSGTISRATCTVNGSGIIVTLSRTHEENVSLAADLAKLTYDMGVPPFVAVGDRWMINASLDPAWGWGANSILGGEILAVK